MSHYLAFVLSNLLAVVVSFGLAHALLPGRTRPQLALATLAGYPLVIIIALLLLGVTGVLTTLGVYLVFVPTACLALLWLGLRRGVSPIATPAINANSSVGSQLAQLAIPISLLAAFASVVVLKASFSGTEFFTDDLGYHAPNVARWIQDGQFTYVTRNLTAYYPFNCELLSLWYVLPFHSDAWAALGGVFWLALIACAAAAVGRELGLTAAAGTLVAVLTICSPSIIWLVRTFSPTDLAAASLILAGIYFTALAIRRIPVGSGASETLYAGLLVGAALGCKVTVAPVFVVLVAALLFTKKRFRSVLIFCFGAALTGSFWYIRNWIDTGNPLFPAEIGPFAGPWTQQQQSVEKLVRLVGKSQSLPQMTEILKKDFDWPQSLAALSVVGYVAALAAELFRTASSSEDNGALRRILLVSGISLLIVYPFAPFSGNDYSWRYITAPFLIGLVLYGRLIDERHWLHWFWRSMALLAVVTCWPGPGKSILVAFVGGAVGLFALHLAVYRLRDLSSVNLAIGSLAGIAALCVALAILTNHQQRATNDNLRQYGAPDQPIGLAWNALDAAPPGSRVAWFLNRSYDYFPLFGRRYQFDPVAVDSNGKLTPPLHELFAGNPTIEVSRSKKSAMPRDAAELLNHLRDAKVDYVLVSKWPVAAWPPQHALLEKSDGLRVFYQDDYSVIWKIKRARQSND